MKARRKVVAGFAVLGLVGGLTLVSPLSAGAQSTVTFTCTGADGPTRTLMEAGSVPQVAIPAAVTATVPATLASGASESVDFSWTLDPGAELVALAGLASITSLDAMLDVKIAAVGGSGGPYQFSPTTVTVGIIPPSSPTMTAAGTITGTGSEISYTAQQASIDIKAYNNAGTIDLKLTCAPSNAVVATTAAGGGGGGGGGTPTTTAPKSNAGNSQATYTG